MICLWLLSLCGGAAANGYGDSSAMNNRRSRLNEESSSSLFFKSFASQSPQESSSSSSQAIVVGSIVLLSVLLLLYVLLLIWIAWLFIHRLKRDIKKRRETNALKPDVLPDEKAPLQQLRSSEAKDNGDVCIQSSFFHIFSILSDQLLVCAES